ncbi:MAG: flagellar basal body-associated FliL family protein [Nitrospirales bacterium]|nr:flagellar basal body-associated FliL family protein [Nitrospira sp.]MDR4502281.1 flagellar basal body-associated FliL family protein [Nitrospirales bacterium]
MAEEEKKEEADVGGGSSKKLILMIVLAVAILGGGGAAAWLMLGSGGGEESHATQQSHDEEAADGHAAEPGPIVELDGFVLNLADREELRYLKMTIKLELDRPEEKTDFPSKVPAIRDSLLVLLSSKESHMLRTTNGKRRVREEILERVNGIMKKGKIANVFFTDFVIQ